MYFVVVVLGYFGLDDSSQERENSNRNNCESCQQRFLRTLNGFLVISEYLRLSFGHPEMLLLQNLFAGRPAHICKRDQKKKITMKCKELTRFSSLIVSLCHCESLHGRRRHFFRIREHKKHIKLTRRIAIFLGNAFAVARRDGTTEYGLRRGKQTVRLKKGHFVN